MQDKNNNNNNNNNNKGVRVVVIDRIIFIRSFVIPTTTTTTTSTILLHTLGSAVVPAVWWTIDTSDWVNKFINTDLPALTAPTRQMLVRGKVELEAVLEWRVVLLVVVVYQQGLCTKQGLFDTTDSNKGAIRCAASCPSREDDRMFRQQLGRFKTEANRAFMVEQSS